MKKMSDVDKKPPRVENIFTCGAFRKAREDSLCNIFRLVFSATILTHFIMFVLD